MAERTWDAQPRQQGPARAAALTPGPGAVPSSMLPRGAAARTRPEGLRRTHSLGNGHTAGGCSSAGGAASGTFKPVSPSASARLAASPAMLRSENRTLYFCGRLVFGLDSFIRSASTTLSSTTLPAVMMQMSPSSRGHDACQQNLLNRRCVACIGFPQHFAFLNCRQPTPCKAALPLQRRRPAQAVV